MEENKLMDNYKQLLEGMSKEQLIAEIGRWIVDGGVLLNSRDSYIEELKAENQRLRTENCYWEDVEGLKEEVNDLEFRLKKTEEDYGHVYQEAVKDTAKEMIEEIDSVKEIFPNDISGYEKAYGWCMCIDKLKEIAKERYGVEVER